jgi:membrane associated rhomboid family serine protease
LATGTAAGRLCASVPAIDAAMPGLRRPADEYGGFRRAVFSVVLFIGVLWIIELADHTFHLHLAHLGIYPRQPAGLRGVLFAPLIHGTWGHLISNSLSLAVLGVALLYGYPRSRGYVLLLIYLGSGLGVWLFARSSYHFGSSGLTHGIMFFIFVSGILRRDKLSIALAMIVFFLYGGMIWSIFPNEPGVSYESHFFGALMGLIAAFLFRQMDPVLPVKAYDWEGEEAELPAETDDDQRDSGDRW